MISISRNFKILIIDDNETDLKVVQRLLSKDYKSIDVTARSGVSDWKIFLEGNKFDMILLNYAAGSSVGLQEIKKIIAVNDTIPVYIMIWQHEVEVGMKAIYQGAEGFVIKDKTYLNLKKVIQRALLNYLVYSELNSLREINDIISEEVNDGFFRFSKEGELEYISDKFASLLGFDSEFETGALFTALFNEIKEHIKGSDDYDREISFGFETTGKDNKPFWFQIFVYKKIDLRNDTLYYEGVLKNISETKNLEVIIKNLKEEKDLLLNNSPLPIEVYGKDGNKLSSNPAFTKMLAGFDVSIKDPLAKAPEAPVLKENLLKTAEVNMLTANNQKITFGNKEKYFDINYISGKGSAESIFAFYNDISENVKYRKIIADINNRKNALYNSTDTGFIELDADGNVMEISEKSLVILGKGINDYSGTPVTELFSNGNNAAIKNALSESKKSGSHNLTINNSVKVSFQSIKNSGNELTGYIIAVDDVGKIMETEEAYKSNAEKVSFFSNIENIFLWVGTISGNSIKPEYSSRAVEKITGYSVNESLETDSLLTEFLFNLKENNTKDKLIKFVKESFDREANFKDKNGSTKRIKIRSSMQKESKDTYKISALIEDVTKLTEQNGNYSGVLSAAARILNIGESALLKVDESLTIQEIYYSSPAISKEIVPGNKFQDFSGIKNGVVGEAAGKALNENIFSDNLFTADNTDQKKYRIVMTPFPEFSGSKSLYVYIQDITNNENLKSDYDYFSKIIESVKEFNSALVLITENDKIVFANSAVEALTGLKKDEIENKYFKELFAEDSCYDEFQKQLKALKKKNHLELNIKLKDKSAAIKYCHFNSSVLQKEGSADRLLLFGTDESEKENLKNDLKYNLELDGILSASQDDAIVVWSNDDVVYCNNTIDSLFGYSTTELQEINRQDLFAQVQESNTKEIMAGFFDSDEFNGKPVEVICKKKHGQEFFAEATVSHHKLQSKPIVILSIRDITDKKHLEKAVFSADNRFRGVIDSLNEGIWLFDSEYKTVFISPKALGFLDYAIDEIHEKRIFYFIKDSKFEFDKRFFEESPEAKYVNLNLSFIKKDNELFHSKVNIIPLKNEKGAFLGGILSLTDTKEILNRDSEISGLKEKNSGLDKKIRSLDMDLKQARQLITDYKKESENLIIELEDKINSSKSIINELDNTNKHLNKLYSVIQSNLRGQVSNVCGFAEFMEQVWSSINPSQQEAYIKILLNNTKQAYRIFDKISLLSKCASGKLKLRTGIINLSSRIKQIINQNSEKVNTKQLTIESDIKENLNITGDQKLIDFIIDELVSNALKFSNTEGNIKIFLQPVHDKVSLTILDNGVGIPAEKLNRIFDLGQIHSVYTSKGDPGSGLSLLIAKEIIHLHHGSIEINSEDGKGTKINIVLPSAHKNIFLIGSETDCEIIGSYITEHYSDFTSQNYYETENALKEISGGNAPCAIFVTYSQPEEKFFTFLDKITSFDFSSTMPIIAMSSDYSDEFKAKLLTRGISTIIALPLNKKNICGAIDGVMFK
jgi:PAS domain S-box-containing protein